MTKLVGGDTRAEYTPPLQKFVALDRQIHIWQLQFSSATPDDTALSPDERTRATQYITQDLSDRFIVGRAFLRKVLASYLGIAPSEVQFAYHLYGKPYLPDSDIRFNLAHSGDVAILAVTRNAEIGIDVEQIRPVDRMAFIAEGHLGAEVAAQLVTLEGLAQQVAFFEAWTRYEALAKMLGTGLGTLQLQGQDYRVIQPLLLPDGYVGALATTNTQIKIVAKHFS